MTADLTPAQAARLEDVERVARALAACHLSGKPYKPRPFQPPETEAFIGPRPEGQQVRHLDGDKTNNHASNLAYGTQSENEIDKLRHGTNLNATKPRCEHGHSLTDPVNVRLYRGRRICRACQAAYRARRRQERVRFVCGADCTYGGLSVTRKHSNGDLGWMGHCNRPVMREADRCFEHQSRAAIGAPATAEGDDDRG